MWLQVRGYPKAAGSQNCSLAKFCLVAQLRGKTPTIKRNPKMETPLPKTKRASLEEQTGNKMRLCPWPHPVHEGTRAAHRACRSTTLPTNLVLDP